MRPVSAFIAAISVAVLCSPCQAKSFLNTSDPPGCWRTSPVGSRQGCDYEHLQNCGLSWNKDHTRGACEGASCCTCADACGECAVFQKGYRFNDPSTGDCITQKEYTRLLVLGVVILVGIIGLVTAVQCCRHKGQPGPCLRETCWCCLVLPFKIILCGLCAVLMAVLTPQAKKKESWAEKEKKRIEMLAGEELYRKQAEEARIRASPYP